MFDRFFQGFWKANPSMVEEMGHLGCLDVLDHWGMCRDFMLPAGLLVVNNYPVFEEERQT